MSLRLKIFSVLAASALLGVLAVLTVWQSWILRDALEHEQQVVQRRVATLGDALTPFLIQNQIGAIHETLAIEMKRDAGWVQLTLLDPSGLKLYPFDDGATVADDGDELIEVTHAIQSQGFELGKILLKHSTREVRQRVQDAIYAALGLIVLGFALSGLVTGWLLNRSVLGPVSALTAAAADLGKGVASTPLPVAQSDEIGQLARGFETMRGQIDDQRRALTEARDQAQAANRAKSEFLASMSHELRTPLNAVVGFSELARADATMSAQARGYLEEVMNSAEHLLALISDIIDLSSIEANRLTLSVEAVAVSEVVNACVAIVAPLAAKRHVTMGVQAHELERLFVRADFMRLRQALINLLSNAIKYNVDGGKVTLEVSRQDLNLRLLVRDTGRGIAPEKQARLFTAFDRLGQEGGLVEGSGIGLIISQKMVRAMGGVMGFESAVGQGSAFWIDVPAIEPPTIAQRVPAHGSSAEGDAATPKLRGTILCVEDNPINMRLMEALLPSLGDFKLLQADSAEEGLDMVERQAPDLVLMDINLPGMSGYEAVAVLRAQATTQHLPVVALTANAMKEDVARARQAGFSAYLTKPLRREALSEVLQTWLPVTTA